MTDTDQPRGTSGPWSVDLLADLHAGVLDESEAASLWQRVQDDPDAMAVLSALDATSADLHALSAEPLEPMPADVVARIDTALAAETPPQAQQPQPGEQTEHVAPVVDMAAARRKRNQRLGWGAGILTAAAAAVAAVVITVPGTSPTEGTPVAEQTEQAEDGAADPGAADGDAPMALNSDGVPAALGDTLDSEEYGALDNEDEARTCLSAVGIDGGDLVGARPVTFDGQDAVLLVMTTGEYARYRMVVVPADCGPDTTEALHDQTVGR